MDSASLMSIVAGASLLVLLLRFFQARSSAASRRRLPPGPRALPVIGNLHLLAMAGKPAHLALADLARTYGPLMSLRLGSHTAVVASSAKYAREILKTQNQRFASRGHTAAGVIMNYDRANVVWAPYGDHLRTGRKILQTNLLNSKRIAASEKVRTEEFLKCLQNILDECEQGTKDICLVEKVSTLFTRIISRTVFGNGCTLFGRDTPQSSELELEFMTLVNNIFRMNGMFVVGDFVPSLKRFDIQGHEREMTKLAAQSDKIYSRILDEHRRNAGAPGAAEPDFVDTLLALQKDEGLSDNAIKAIVADLIFAATDTSAQQTAWTFAELMRHPEVAAKARQELDAVVGRDRLVREADIARLPYLQAVVKESLRLHPVAALLPYESTEDCHIDGFFVPAGSRVFVNNHAISRAAESWESPLQFRPERFAGAGARDVRGQDFELLPFGAGRRQCIGMAMGLLGLQGAVAQLLHACHFALPAGLGPRDVDTAEDFGISTPMKTRLRLVATPRLAPSLVKSTLAALRSD